MSTIRNHRDLEAWRWALETAIETYKLTDRFPSSETYGLRSQMRRASVSVPSNIAEGQSRPARACLNHLSIALGSLAELDTQVEVALRLKYVTVDDAKELRRVQESTTRLVAGLRRAKRMQITGSTVIGAVTILGLFLSLAR